MERDEYQVTKGFAECSQNKQTNKNKKRHWESMSPWEGLHQSNKFCAFKDFFHVSGREWIAARVKKEWKLSIVTVQKKRWC